MNSKKKLDINTLRWWEKQLRAPIGALFIMLSILIIWATSNNGAALIPTENVPVVIVSNQAGDNLKATIKTAIMNAKSSIIILMYSLTDQDILRALKEKAESGVQISIVHDAVATQDVAFKLTPTVVLRPR